MDRDDSPYKSPTQERYRHNLSQPYGVKMFNCEENRTHVEETFVYLLASSLRQNPYTIYTQHYFYLVPFDHDSFGDICIWLPVLYDEPVPPLRAPKEQKDYDGTVNLCLYLPRIDDNYSIFHYKISRDV